MIGIRASVTPTPPVGSTQLQRVTLLHLVVVLGSLGCTQSESERNTVPAVSSSASRPIGKLGYPLGTYLRIEAHPYRPTTPPLKVLSGTMLVNAVRDERLETPIKLVVRNLDLSSVSPDTPCVINGYESGAWVGSPEGLPPGTPTESTRFHFHNYFVVTSVDAPKELAQQP